VAHHFISIGYGGNAGQQGNTTPLTSSELEYDLIIEYIKGIKTKPIESGKNQHDVPLLIGPDDLIRAALKDLNAELLYELNAGLKKLTVV